MNANEQHNGWGESGPAMRHFDIQVPPYGLAGTLSLPAGAHSLIVFVHGSGSSHLSPRNQAVARALNKAGMATFLFDLLTPEEDRVYQNRFDIPRLARRLADAVRWLDGHDALRALPIGLFGASTGAAAALIGAVELEQRVGAVVSRGGRPDLAGDALERIRAPVLLLVGGRDTDVLRLNQQALTRLPGSKDLQIIPGATHLFEEPGALEAVIGQAIGWFERHLGRQGRTASESMEAASIPPPASHDEMAMELNGFQNRADAGRRLAQRLAGYKDKRPVILALPRGGVPVAAQVAETLEAPLDLVLVRKIGVPTHPELAMGAVVDGAPPVTIRNEEIIRYARISDAVFNAARDRELEEIHRRRQLYLGHRRHVATKGRTVIVIDDGIATGATALAALRAIRHTRPAYLILAVPVGAASTLHKMAEEADEVLCLLPREDLGAVGYYYRDFRQTSDRDVIALLAAHPAKGNSAPERI